jgi:hypothetical protein
MNVEIRTKAKQFPEKEYINGIFIAVQSSKKLFSALASGLSKANLVELRSSLYIRISFNT